MSELQQWLPWLAPIILIQLALMIAALVDLKRRERARGPKWVWALVVIFINIIGPVIYFTLGRED